MNRPICIIDDDEDIRGVLKFALEYENIQVITFGNCQEAEEFLARAAMENLPCLIFVDYMMPGMSGIEFISLITKKYPDTISKIPMVLCTGFFSEEIESLPANIFKLEKPIDLNNFLKIAKEYYLAPEKPFSLF